MIGIKLRKNEGIKILCLGSHCDDIEIGCGGTLLSLLHKYQGRGVEVYWVVFSSNTQRKKEALLSSDVFLRQAWKKTVRIEKFQDSYFPYIGREIKDYFVELNKGYAPDIVFTHYGKDLHQDHRMISELTWNIYREHLILEYEIPKYDGDIGKPNLFIPLESSMCKKKVDTIMKSFHSQRKKHWMAEDLHYSILRIRGMECASRSNFAEAFYCRKMLLE